jgi:hypothetical protein
MVLNKAPFAIDSTKFYIDSMLEQVVKDYTVGIKYVRFISYPTRDSNGEKRAKA